MPVADEQEGKEAGQLPEDDQLDQIARQHHALHGAHEGQQEGEEARHRILRRHVVARIQDHERADPQDQGAEQPGQAVQADGEIDPKRRQPGQGQLQHLAVLEPGPEHRQTADADQGDDPRQDGRRGPRMTRQPRGDHGPQKGQDENDEQEEAGGHGRVDHLRWVVGRRPKDCGSRLFVLPEFFLREMTRLRQSDELARL
ncbi:hypothetical protein D3C73_1056150 [compost metagenome]